MIGVKMREQNRIDVVARDVGCGERLAEMAELGAGERGGEGAGAGVDEIEVVAGIHRVGIGRRVHGVRRESALGERLLLFGLGLGEKFGWKREVAVQERRHLDIADRLAEDAGNLFAGERRARQSGRRERCIKSEGGSAGEQFAARKHGNLHGFRGKLSQPRSFDTCEVVMADGAETRAFLSQ